jgi:hypothetical protein
VAAKKTTMWADLKIFFTKSYLVGAQKKYAQTHSTVVMLLQFLLILQLPKITKAQAQYHACCQYELLFSKWLTIVEISHWPPEIVI